MPTQMWISLIAAVASLAVALVSAGRSRQAQREVAELTNRFAEQRAERDARRDYEYDAKKRLYAECEPVLFEALELADMFRRRVISLARAARHDELRADGSGWLASEGYYFRSTAYYLLAPATSLKLLQRRLTAVDLALEPRIAFQYQLIKELFHSYTWDHDLATAAPALDYRPEAGDGGPRQGLYLGVVDQLAEALITPSGRCKSVGEFWAEFDDADSPVGRQRGDLRALFGGFHPDRAPVLWRVLVSQYLLCGALLRSREAGAGVATADEALREGLDWRPPDADLPLDEVRTPLVVAHDRVTRRLAALPKH